jgi:penicillin-binding protein 1B
MNKNSRLPHSPPLGEISRILKVLIRRVDRAAMTIRTQRTRVSGHGLMLMRSKWMAIPVGITLAIAIAGSAVILRYYAVYSTIIDRRLNGEVFAATARIYATPYVVYPGQRITADQVVVRLRRAGFEPMDGALTGAEVYNRTVDGDRTGIVVSPPDRSDYRMDFSNGRLVRASEVLSGFEMDRVELPPELVTTLFDDTRAKRRLLSWEQLPPLLTDAIIASEDKRFYQHFGIDLIRAAGAAWANFRGNDRQGASTLTMQLAGSFFLNRNERTWSRKLPEIFMALILEQRLTKQQIFTMYANEMYLGHRGSFAINGFGEAAAAYFGKDIADLELSEAATLVGMLPAPNAYAPTRNLERSTERRNTVLAAMYDEDMINMEQLSQAELEEIALADITVDQTDAPYMVDYIREQMLEDFSEGELLSGGLRVHTTLNPDLQRAAVKAVALGIANAEEQLRAIGRGPSAGGPPVQAALIALDPHTGAIKAMVGGRDYGASQYNRITEAFRQPGSIFKPFVYAAAFESAFDPLPVTAPPAGIIEAAARWDLQNGHRMGYPAAPDPTPRDADGRIHELPNVPPRVERGTIRTDSVITPLTTLTDEPTYFFYDNDRYYRPDNYRDVFHGLITAREALQRSLNVPTVKIAERVGYERVARFAHRAGFGPTVLAYPSLALGSFEVSPIDIAGAWTTFANGGVRVEPRAIERVLSGEGGVLASYPVESSDVMRPELAAVMTSLLQNVIDHGTGVGVGAMGFTRPAAGKTGTSRDGWFAGYTTNLLVIAWVGFDDNRDLELEGSRSALPIWTAFMMDADRLDPDGEGRTDTFVNPPGVEAVSIDPGTLMLASPDCIDRVTQVFISGTAPTSYCPIHGGGPGFSLRETFTGIGRALSGVFRD